jgi:hypothetical protein
VHEPYRRHFAHKGTYGGTPHGGMGSLRPKINTVQPPIVATARIISKKQKGEQEYQQPDLELMKSDEKLFAHNIALFKNEHFYKQWRPDELKGTPKEQAEAVVNRMQDNIIWLYNEASAADKRKNAQWSRRCFIRFLFLAVFGFHIREWTSMAMVVSSKAISSL